MKKTLVLVLAVAMVFCFAACGKKEEAVEPVELTVFAAASLTEACTEIGKQYMAANPNVKITFNFDSSGTLLTQINEGAVCDLFISAAQKQMNTLDEAGALLDGTRLDLLENKCALAVADGNPKNIESFSQLCDMLKNEDIKFAMGNSDVPVGAYTQNIFKYYGVDEAAVASKITYGGNVKAVTTAVSESTVDCGIIYASDAYSAGLTVVALSTSEETGGRVIYPAAVLKASTLQDEAKAFLEYLQGPEASAAFEAVLFTPLAK